MTILKGRNVKVEIATTYAAADVVTAITAANPAVVSSTAHAQANGTVGYLTGVVGMEEIEGQAYYVANTTANTFEMKGFDASSYAAATAANAIAATAWATLSQATSVSIAGGEASQQDVTTLINRVRQNESGMMAAQTVTMDGFSIAGGNTALTTIRSAAQSNGYVLVKMTYQDTGDVRVFRGQTGMPGESTSIDAPVTTSMSFTVKGQVTFA
jgi:hypothetical protein